MTERPSAVRLFPVDHPALANTLRRKLMLTQGERIGQLGKGYASDWADYQKRVGAIEGLELAMKLCDQAEKELNGES